MLKQLLKLNEYKVYVDSDIEIYEHELECLEKISKYGIKILKDYDKKRLPKKLTESFLIKQFVECEELIKKLNKNKKKGLNKFFFNLIKGFEKCKYCGQEAIFVSFAQGYKNYCNNVECYEKEAKSKVKEKYGVDNVFQLSEIKEKSKQTNLKKYGTVYASQSTKIKNKIVQTNLQKYGVKNVSQSNEVKNKRKQTFLKKYGVDNPTKNKQIIETIRTNINKKFGVKWVTQIPDVKDKIKKTHEQKYGKWYVTTDEFKEKFVNTMKNKYGVENAMLHPIFKEKLKRTNLEKFGCEYAFQSDEIKQKIKQTIKEKYGVEHHMKNDMIKQKVSEKHKEKAKKFDLHQQKNIKNKDKLNKEFIVENFIKDNKINIIEMTKFYNITKSSAYAYLRKFDIDYDKFHSQIENEIGMFLKENNVEFEVNVKNIIAPYELDFYIPDENLAIEFNGLMYHSFGKSKYSMFDNFDEMDKNYHLKKTNMCEKKGIMLLHIFENEWMDENKKDIWKSVILSKLGKTPNKIYARKCKIKEISSKDAYDFLNKNHLQGGIYGKVNLGLFYNDELIAVMNFVKRRFDKKEGFELLRYASKIYTNVIGGFSKLLNYFELNYNPTMIISYANRRWSVGNVYEKNGFEFVKESVPNFFYFKPNEYKLYSRIKFQKHNLYNILKTYNPNKTAIENIIENGYRIIFDSGNKVYIKKCKE